MDVMSIQELVGAGKPFKNKTALARAVGVSKQACSKWKRLPAEHCITVEEKTKRRFGLSFTRYRTRPDIFGDHPPITNHSPQREANDAGTVGSGHRSEALATGDLQPNKTSRGTPPESQGQPQVCAVRRRRRVPSSNPSSPRGGGTSAPFDAGDKR